MKQQLFFLAAFVVFLAVPSHGQTVFRQTGNATAGVICNLNLTNDLPDINAQCSVSFADLIIPSIIDDCGNTVVPTTDGSIFPVTTPGTTTIEWAYVDNGGNTETQTQDVKINDFTEPVPDAAVLPDFNAQCEVQEADLPVPTATDNCGGFVTVTNDGVFPITAQGITTITWSFKDDSGNASTQTQDIVLFDFTEPTPDVALLPDFFSSCAVQQIDLPVPTATDNCGGAVTVTSDAVFPITASTLITWTYTDANGNSAAQLQDIYINDFTEPTPDVVILPDFFSSCAVQQIDLPVPTATDNCSGLVTVTTDAVFPITASTLITWTYTDASGNGASQLQDVYINDFTEPTPDIAILSDFFSSCAVQQIDLPVPTATDNCGGVVTVTSDVVFPITVSTLITWTYTDDSGNSASQLQDVYINDFTAPTPDLAILPDVVSSCAVQQIDVPTPTATDNCGGLVTVTSDAVFPITASTLITWTYTDASGNTEAQLQDIIITDLIAPVADVATLADVISQCAIVEADLVGPTATDNCSGVVTVTNDGIFPITASTTLTWTYTDGNGNATTQGQEIIINDTTAPTANIAILTDITAQCEVLAIDVVEPTATDNCSGLVTVTSDAVFPITSSTTITWTYTDASGNDTEQTQQVIINDTTAPVAEVTVLTDITAQCQVLAIDVDEPTATDNCAGIVTVTNDAVFPITASTTITWTYTDASGNNAIQTQQVVINDTTAPVADVAFLADITSPCEVLAIDVTEPTASDNCGGLVTVTSDAVFPITSSTTITWTYTDTNGNTDTQTQEVIIDDSAAPVPDAAFLADIISECAVAEADVAIPTATDNCSTAITVTSNAVFPITSSTTITWTYTDANGNSETQNQEVIINDISAPVPDFALLADIIAQCEVLENDVDIPSATDNCGGIVIVTNDAVFPITSSTNITWTYTDGNGNAETQAQQVIVNDTTAPTPDAIVLSDIIAQCEVREIDVDAPTATDNCSGMVTVTSDAVFPITSSTAITWTYTDTNGNSNTQTQQVIINDNIAPTPDLVSLADITAECEVLETDVPVPTATDNCSGIVTVSNDAIFPITASTTITWTYTDSNANSSTQSQLIIISDTTAPVPDSAILADVVGACEILSTDITAPTATDNCSGVVSVTNDAVFPITSSTTITWVYTDASGNTSAQTQEVVISDTIAPSMTLTDLTVSVDVTGNVSITPSQLENGSSADNCGIASLTVVPDAFDCSQLGDHLVTVTVTDIHGNSFSDTATVTVNDPTDFCGALGVVKSEKTTFVLYPNPTVDIVYVSAKNATALQTIRVYSFTGQLVLEHSYHEKSNLYSLSIGSLAAGSYLLKLETEQGNLIERIVKQ